ncbi:MAG: alpha/beta hydrolase [Anaerolineae bacterium]|nr:alpha/beta hydrolase [Anaerolineae bacterium]MDW8173011.1 alpha/beta hydrolase [Anaerolineae bacterium]
MHNLTTFTFYRDDLALVYDDDPAHEGVPVLLLHGLTTNRWSWRGLLRNGLGEGRRVLIPDLRGRGGSAKPPRGYTMDDHVQDLLALLDDLLIRRADVVGHSFGGLLGAYLAAHHPQRVRRLVIVDAGLEATDPAVLPKIRPSLERLGQVAPSWEAYLKAIKSAHYYADGFWDDDLEALYRADITVLDDGRVRSVTAPHAIEQAMEGVISLDWPSTFARVNCPTLLVNAPAPFPNGLPPVLSEASARETVSLMPRGQYAAVEGNHITLAYGPYAATTAETIEAFLLAS